MNSRVSNKVVNIAEPPRNSKPFLISINLACPTCKKCIYRANHDACIFQYLSEAVGGKLCDKSAEESWEIIEELALYDNESLNDPSDLVGKAHEKVLVREENSKPVTQYVNAIFLFEEEGEEVEKYEEVIDIKVVEQSEVLGDEGIEEEEEMDENELDKSRNDNPTRWGKYADRLIEMPRSHPIGYYLKHDINRKTVEDVLVELAGFVYPIDFVILDIEENEYMPLILGTPFLTMVMADIRCSDGSMTLRAGKFKVRFIKTLRFHWKVKKKESNDLDPLIPTNYVNIRILEWEERIKSEKKK
nr:hypothetical protein [Tanacetum cinerariifolium]